MADDSVFLALRALPILVSLDDDEVRTLAGLAERKTYARGSYAFRESQPRRAFGTVVSGRIDIIKGFQGLPQVLHVLGPGESFGEGSLLDEYPHSTSGVVREEAEVLEIPRGGLRGIAETDTRLFGKLAMAAAQLISSRLRYANARLSNRGLGYVSGELRTEHDLIGEREVPAEAFWGVHTLRAMENFPITGIPIGVSPHLVEALAA
ncbi:MAG TPA: cyclic nucleotide-binding domain-containing protein, partial [Longimicrobium sp.]|nr:cyclic nucleotide-binding domain-containing protein [Longimicrobium sp.]